MPEYSWFMRSAWQAASRIAIKLCEYHSHGDEIYWLPLYFK